MKDMCVTRDCTVGVADTTSLLHVLASGEVSCENNILYVKA